MEVDSVDSILDSPTTTSRAINMMDLDPNIMDEPYDSGFLQSSAPIPIRLNQRCIIANNDFDHNLHSKYCRSSVQGRSLVTKLQGWEVNWQLAKGNEGKGKRASCASPEREVMTIRGKTSQTKVSARKNMVNG